MERTAIAGFLLLLAVIVVLVRKRAQFRWPLTGKITSPFGLRTAPVTGASTDHLGIDISANVGTPVKAPAAGNVTRLYKTASGGNQLEVTHKNGWISGYAHLSTYAVKLNQAVATGQVIAYSGNTGNTTGPHLHFSLRNQAGQYVDPQAYLS